jgi:hypothetical protein
MLAAKLNGSIEHYSFSRLQGHQNRGSEEIGAVKISPGFNPVGARPTMANTDPIQHAGKLGAGSKKLAY